MVARKRLTRDFVYHQSADPHNVLRVHVGLAVYLFLSFKCCIDAKAPVKSKKRAHSIPLLVPISTLLKLGSHTWKKGLDQL